MSISAKRTDQPRNFRAIPWLLCLTLMAASPGASAGWLDKLKDRLGSGEQDEEQTTGAVDVSAGLKEALRVGTETVVGRLGQTGGFNLDPLIHIPLPDKLDQIRNVLEKVGMESQMTELELGLNRAAEVATPKAKTLFMQAISDMTLDDAMAIYNGPDDAATQYFRSKMSAPLAAEMKPVVDESLAEVGAATTYDSVMDRYHALPFVPPVEADLGNYVVEKGMDGIFYYLAREEAAIRQDPAKRTTDILKRVFGR